MTILSQVTFKYEKKKTKGRKKRQSSKDLRLLGWRLNPVLPGALSTRLQERTVIAKTIFNDRKTVLGGGCQIFNDTNIQIFKSYS